MKKVRSTVLSKCLLVMMLSIYANSYLHAGVTSNGVTAYSPIINSIIIFSDNPADDPRSYNAPLGGGRYLSGKCNSYSSTAGVEGLICVGTPEATIENYICRTTYSVVQPDTSWCLISENPRPRNRSAWAIKYVNGLIPTNDGASIVRCAPTDIFDSEFGCFPEDQSTLSTQIRLKDGYIQLDTVNTAPPLEDCEIPPHWGRMVIDSTNDLLYICTESSGWISK